ncbi:MAG TPA: DoxX family protein [Candidatus Acidoferrales bacterium]|nr:DoxX family protein [Candidatus Acidoferrales bacterium]
MNPRWQVLAIPALRWTLSLVLFIESLQFTFSRAAARQLAHAGLPQWLRPVIGGAEIIAALLFLLPATTALGGRLLLAIFVIVAAIHFFHGQFDVSLLALYAVAVLVCLAHRKNPAPDAPHD